MAGLHLELADGDSAPGLQVDLVPVLDDPARSDEVRVDQLASLLLGVFLGRRHGVPAGEY